MNTAQLDKIWNRAALEDGGPSPKQGDRALAALLLAHGVVMNGGVHHALETLSEHELAAAAAGFRFFELNAVGDLLQRTSVAADITEEVADCKYAELVPDDSTLFDAFAVVYLRAPHFFKT